MSEGFRERVYQAPNLVAYLTEYEIAHPLEWCKVSDEIMKESYPDECDTAEQIDEKAQSIPELEFEARFIETIERYRAGKSQEKDKQKKQKREQDEERQKVVASS